MSDCVGKKTGGEHDSDVKEVELYKCNEKHYLCGICRKKKKCSNPGHGMQGLKDEYM